MIEWDGGNNETPFFVPTSRIVGTDPHRAGLEMRYYPGETDLRMADMVVINKVDAARPEDLDTPRANIASVNPDAITIEAALPVLVDDPAALLGKKVRVVEDCPIFEKTSCDLVISGTPIDPSRVIRLDKPSQRVRYVLQKSGKPDLVDLLVPVLS